MVRTSRTGNSRLGSPIGKRVAFRNSATQWALNQVAELHQNKSKGMSARTSRSVRGSGGPTDVSPDPKIAIVRSKTSSSPSAKNKLERCLRVGIPSRYHL